MEDEPLFANRREAAFYIATALFEVLAIPSAVVAWSVGGVTLNPFPAVVLALTACLVGRMASWWCFTRNVRRRVPFPAYAPLFDLRGPLNWLREERIPAAMAVIRSGRPSPVMLDKAVVEGERVAEIERRRQIFDRW